MIENKFSHDQKEKKNEYHEIQNLNRKNDSLKNEVMYRYTVVYLL